MSESDQLRYIYCPGHLGIHHAVGNEPVWCTCSGHIELGADRAEAYAASRRAGRVFFCGDVENLRDSATDPEVGDVVGDKRVTVCGRYHIAYLREVLGVNPDTVVWCRPNGRRARRTSRKAWQSWARGAWRCNPTTGKPTRRRFLQERDSRTGKSRNPKGRVAGTR